MVLLLIQEYFMTYVKSMSQDKQDEFARMLRYEACLINIECQDENRTPMVFSMLNQMPESHMVFFR